MCRAGEASGSKRNQWGAGGAVSSRRQGLNSPRQYCPASRNQAAGGELRRLTSCGRSCGASVRREQVAGIEARKVRYKAFLTFQPRDIEVRRRPKSRLDFNRHTRDVAVAEAAWSEPPTACSERALGLSSCPLLGCQFLAPTSWSARRGAFGGRSSEQMSRQDCEVVHTSLPSSPL